MCFSIMLLNTNTPIFLKESAGLLWCGVSTYWHDEDPAKAEDGGVWWCWAAHSRLSAPFQQCQDLLQSMFLKQTHFTVVQYVQKIPDVILKCIIVLYFLWLFFYILCVIWLIIKICLYFLYRPFRSDMHRHLLTPKINFLLKCIFLCSRRLRSSRRRVNFGICTSVPKMSLCSVGTMMKMMTMVKMHKKTLQGPPRRRSDHRAHPSNHTESFQKSWSCVVCVFLQSVSSLKEVLTQLLDAVLTYTEHGRVISELFQRLPSKVVSLPFLDSVRFVNRADSNI